VKQQTSVVTGTHILAQFITDNQRFLTDAAFICNQISALIKQFSFTKIGQVVHAFPEGGYSCVIALAESHLTLHTWPELSYATFDLFVCNYTRDNSRSAHDLYQEIVGLAKPSRIKMREIMR